MLRSFWRANESCVDAYRVHDVMLLTIAERCAARTRTADARRLLLRRLARALHALHTARRRQVRTRE